MLKTFYDSSLNNKNISRQKIRIKDYNSININNNNKNNIYKENNNNYFNESERNNISYKKLINSERINYDFTDNKITSKFNNENKKEKNETGYIFYGKNKLFKTRNNGIINYNISAKNKKNNIFNQINLKNSNKNISLNSNNQINNNYNDLKLYKDIKMPRQLSSDLILSNNKYQANKNNNFYNDKKKLGKSSYRNFPDIYGRGLNKRRNENDLNINYLFNDNNKDIQFEQLNQLHRNFINSIKNPSGIFSDKEINNNFVYDFDYNYTIKNKKNKFYKLNNNTNNHKWFHNEKINEYINKEDIKKIKNNYIKLNNNNNKLSYEKMSSDINPNLELNKEKLSEMLHKNDIYNIKYKKFNDKKLFKKIDLNHADNRNNSKNEKNNVINKSNSIKIKIKKFIKDKTNSSDKNESKSSSIFSINFSNENINKDNELKNKNKNKFSNDNYNDKNNFKSFLSQNITYKNNFSNIFSFHPKDNNFSYNSTKNMKIEENTNNNHEKKNNKDIKINEENEEANVKYNFKTSSYFFTPKFKNNENNKKDNNSNIEDIIKNVIENNKKVAEARASTSFYNIGKNFLNNKMRDSQKNFYSSSNSKKTFTGEKDTNFEKNQTKDSYKRKFNSIQLTLFSPADWEKHEEIWKNISNKNFNEKFEHFLLPPNDTDIIISNYLRIYPNKLNICNYSKINAKSKNEKEFLSFYIDDDIQNPKNEIKKWKNVYKNMIFRWHPDKLFPLLKELKIKNEYIKKELERRSSLIINNINSLYQNIMEILKKIILYKEKSENINK